MPTRLSQLFILTTIAGAYFALMSWNPILGMFVAFTMFPCGFAHYIRARSPVSDATLGSAVLIGSFLMAYAALGFNSVLSDNLPPRSGYFSVTFSSGTLLSVCPACVTTAIFFAICTIRDLTGDPRRKPPDTPFDD